MAEQTAQTKTAPKRSRPPGGALAVITATLGLFLVVLTLLAIQVRSGRDPALGPGLVAPVTGEATVKGTKGTQTQQATTIVSRTSPVPPP
jgi:hypothetical protein